MANFRPRQQNEDLSDYLKAKQVFELQTTGRSGVDLGTTTPLSPITGVQEPTTTETTGDPLYDQILKEIQPLLDKLTTQGKTINPNVQITPEKVAEFMSVASREIDPYYSTQFKLAKDTFLKDLGYAQEDILRQEQDTERKYGQQLRQLGETMAESGFAQSGIRKRQEQDLALSTQQQIEENRRRLSQGAESTAGQFAQQYGGQAMPTSNITQAPRVLSGIGAFERPQGVAPLYQLSPDTYESLVGQKTYEQEAEKRRRASELENAYRIKEEGRLLSELQ